MAQSSSEIKIIPPKSVSRDRKSHELGTIPQTPAVEPKEENLNPTVARREFFQAVIPASGKLLAGFLRNFSVAVGTVMEEAKARPKKKSD